MNVSFSPEEEAQLSRVAGFRGTDVEQLVRTAALELLAEKAQFREGVQRGLAAAERGDFVEHSELLSGLEAILRS